MPVFHSLKIIQKESILRCFPFFFLIFALFLGCTHEKEDSLREDAKNALTAIHKDLKVINSRQEVIRKRDVLEKKFLDLVLAIIQLREMGLTLSPVQEKGLADSLQREILSELQRLYQIDGCQEVIESIQDAALERLDKYEHERELRLKKRESSIA